MHLTPSAMDWVFFFLLACIYGSALASPPLLMSPSQGEVVKYANESYIASCRSDRGIHTMWIRPSGEQITQTKGRIHVEERWQVKGVNLIFESVEKKDRGNYTCMTTVDGNEHRAVFKLVVINPISFLDTPTIQNASEHQDMLIRCEVDGDPEPKVAWQVKGKQPQAPKHKVMADGLYIRNVTLADRGDYLCRAFQASPIASNIAEQTIALRVHHKPQWPSEQSEREGAYGFVAGHVNLSCAAVAEPAASFEWLKENRTIGAKDTHALLFSEPSRSVLQLSVHNASVFGEYVCRASNALGALERVVVLREAARPSTPKTVVVATAPKAFTLKLASPTDLAPSNGPAPLEVSGFRVQVKRRDDEDWDSASVYDFKTDSGQQYEVSGLEPSSVYTIRVAARNAAGLGEFGPEQNYRTAPVSAAAVEAVSGAPRLACVPALLLLLLALPC